MVDFAKQIAKMQVEMLQLEKLWEIKKFTPNNEQKDAILHVDGPLYITAGPGTGKTRVLLWRALNLIVFHGIKPEEVYLSTFTEKAAHQLKEGLRELLSIVTSINGQPYDLTRMYIGTVHSLCQRILTDRRNFIKNPNENTAPNLLDELGQYFHISRKRNWDKITESFSIEEVGNVNEIVNLLYRDNKRSKHAAVTNCISFFNRASEECIETQEVIARLENSDEEMEVYFHEQGVDIEDLTQIFKIYATYQETLKRSNKIRSTDFSLLQQEAYEVIRTNPESITVFKHVIIDEYQDTNTIQEKIFFELAKDSHNICVVGDDDQALYRFRGATVENFVDFPARCKKYLGVSPTRIPLSTNYRSRKRIVDFYSRFIKAVEWKQEDGNGGYYRVMDKDIKAHRNDNRLSMVASTPQEPEQVCAEIATLVKRLLDEGKVEDPNQIAFLYPSLKSIQVERMREALESVGLKVYAPRAGRFIEVEESYDVFGLIALVLGLPEMEGGWGGEYGDFCDWIDQVEINGKELCRYDTKLNQFVAAKKEEIARVCRDYLALQRVVERERWQKEEDYDIARMKRKLIDAPGFSKEGKKLLGSAYLDRIVEKRIEDGRPFLLNYIVKRVTSLDWSVLDLFYRLCGFDHFKRMFDLAQSGEDEGPICNLSLITQYLARFVEEFIPMLTADLIVDNIFHRVFYFSFLFALYRLGESEYEDAEDPFPKGRIPFLTIHQAKGLEFPVVVLGNPSRRMRLPGFVDQSILPFSQNIGAEPLERQPEFDTARMFYVALSRAQNLLVVAHYRGRGQSINEPFRSMFANSFPRIPDLDISSVPQFSETKEELPKMYSYTSDFLLYKKCPRQYMIFRKYGFVPSRAQMMFFGSLVHRTLEDLHNEIIRRREEGLA